MEWKKSWESNLSLCRTDKGIVAITGTFILEGDFDSLSARLLRDHISHDCDAAIQKICDSYLSGDQKEAE